MAQMQQHFSQGQTLRQEQILAPQQIQSLEILTLPVMELENRIDQELLSNPVLETGDPLSGSSADSASSSPEPDSDSAPGSADASSDFDSAPDSGEAFPGEELDPSRPSSFRISAASGDAGAASDSENGIPSEIPNFDVNRDDFTEGLEKYLENGSGEWSDFLPGNAFREENSTADYSPESEDRRRHLFDSIVAEKSLQEDLMEQLRLSDVPAELKTPAEEIIGSIDNAGYLKTPLADIAQATSAEMKTVEKALKLVQSFDPPGIGARDLRECLLLQIERRNKAHSHLAELVERHFDLVARNKLPQAAKEMGISMEELNRLMEELHALNPHPASSISAETPVYVVPEVIVEPDGEEFKVSLNSEHIPRLVISPVYMRMLEDPSLPDETKSYLRQKLASGRLLIRALEERGKTILRIAELIVSMQHDFLRKGTAWLKPMTMQYIAERIGLHETTVSRAVANKYMQTPKGLFEFRFFFSGGFRSENGEEISSRGIKEIIRDAVAAEDPAAPLSDSRIMEMLKSRGFEVARRTVAKYREELGIQSSQMRKVF